MQSENPPKFKYTYPLPIEEIEKITETGKQVLREHMRKMAEIDPKLWALVDRLQ